MKGLILHTALLLGNIGVFIGLTGGQGLWDGREAGAGQAGRYSERQIDAQGQAGTAPGGDVAAALASLGREQARLRDELARLKPPSDMRHTAAPAADRDGKCKDTGDNQPGVTVYLDTSPSEPPQDRTAPAGRQWTAVSFKEVGQAPDGSKQAVMSIQKTEVKNGAADFIPARAAPRWQ